MTRILLTQERKNELIAMFRTEASQRVNEVTDLFHDNYYTQQRASQKIREITAELERKIRDIDRTDYIDV